MLASASRDDTVRLWDVETGSHMKTLMGHTADVKQIAISPRFKKQLQVGVMTISYTYGMLTPVKLRSTITGHLAPISSMAFSADGSMVAIGASKEVQLWNSSEGVLKNTLFGHIGGVECVAFNPVDNTLASGGSDETIHIWDASKGKRKKIIKGHVSARDIYSIIRYVAYSPDGKILASGSNDRTIRLWDASTGRHKKTLSGHTGAVRTLVFSPDGGTIVSGSGSDDNTVRLWDVQTGKEKEVINKG